MHTPEARTDPPSPSPERNPLTLRALISQLPYELASVCVLSSPSYLSLFWHRGCLLSLLPCHTTRCHTCELRTVGQIQVWGPHVFSNMQTFSSCLYQVSRALCGIVSLSKQNFPRSVRFGSGSYIVKLLWSVRKAVNGRKKNDSLCVGGVPRETEAGSD